MIAQGLASYLPIVVMLCLQTAPPDTKSKTQPSVDPPAQKSPEERFEALLDSAKQDPSKADWIALRHAFAQTSYYLPYNSEWKTELGKVRKDIAEDHLKDAEMALGKLLERERFMRIDALATAVALYEKKGDKDKSRKHRELFEAMAGSVFVPGRGISIERPIEVLFIEEEYFLLASLRIRPGMQSLREQDGHFFDVLTIPASRDRPEHAFYFNIDMPHKALGRLLKAFDKPDQPEAK
jgi:hypothetical protein